MKDFEVMEATRNTRAKYLPNLFIVGAPKCGSTSLHHYLGEHPEIFMCTPKETFFFIKERNWGKGLDWYLSHFQNVKDERYVGESTVAYTLYPKYSGVPERIHQFNPNAKLIYIMRDPVRRSISHYWHNVRWHNEERGLLETLMVDSDIDDASNYYLQISQFLQYFKLEQFYFLTFEEMISNPSLAIKKILLWLKIKEDLRLDNLGEKFNATPTNIFIPKNRLIGRLKDNRAADKFAPLIPKKIKSKVLNFTHKKFTCSEAEIKQSQYYLRSIQQKQVQKLSLLLNRSFQEWKTLKLK